MFRFNREKENYTAKIELMIKPIFLNYRDWNNTCYTKNPVTDDVARTIIESIQKGIRLYQYQGDDRRIINVLEGDYHSRIIRCRREKDSNHLEFEIKF